jgi:hypothetical protein
MSWDDFTRRRKAILDVLDYAAQHPGCGLPFEEVPGVAKVFADRYALVLALQYQWRQALWARLELLSLDSAKDGFVEAKDLVRKAWDECAKAQPVLRGLLDSTAAEFATSLRRALTDQGELMTSANIGHTATTPRHSAPYVA